MLPGSPLWIVTGNPYATSLVAKHGIAAFGLRENLACRLIGRWVNIFQMSSKARVLIVEDHPIVRQGIAQVLNVEPDLVVCGEADCARKAMVAIEELKPDVAIVDVALQGTNGIELTRNITAQWPELPILVLSMHDENLYAERALRAGAKGYLMKQEASTTLTAALRRILKGQIHVSEKLAREIMVKAIDGKTIQDTAPATALSNRELEVLQRVGQGHTTRQIAADLALSIKTVETHRAHIKEKLNLKSAPEMVRYAVHHVTAAEVSGAGSGCGPKHELTT